MILLKTVSFGIDCTGLTTVGYTLINDDGSEKQARTTTGIFEAGTNSGVYGANINFDENWNGIILWNDGNDLFASEEYNYLLEDTTSTIDLTVEAIETTGGKLDTIYQKLPEDGIADAQDSTTILGIVTDIDTKVDVIDNKIDSITTDSTTILNVVNDIETKVDLISDDLKSSLGLMHENIYIDLPTYDDDCNLIGARIRIYSNATSVGTNNNIIGTYAISVTGDGPGKFTSWKQEKI